VNAHDIKTVLVDNRNVATILPTILAELGKCKLWGLDCETTDVETRHEGLNAYNNATRLVFDHRRTTMTGFSVYVEGSDTAYYFNLAHADVANRLHPDIVKIVLDAVSPDAIGVAHNLPFELVMFKQCHGIDLQNFVCTLQMAVSHHGPDEYDLRTFEETPLPLAFTKVAKEVLIQWQGFEGGRPSGVQQELLGKFIAKESKAEHSYNGYVKSIAKGYSLKTLTFSRFGVKQTSFKEVLGEKTHMGQLTGPEVAAYGADDAYWAVKHYRWMFDEMLRWNPHALKAFFETENPMVYVYADSWREGIRLDLEQVFERRDIERADMAQLLRDFKGRLRAALPFEAEPPAKLIEKEAWYAKGWQKKRKQFVDWANSPDDPDDFRQLSQVSNPIGNAWITEKGQRVPASGKLNIVYYHGMRTLMYDLLRLPLQYSEGSVASDKEARGRVRELLEAKLPKTQTPMDVDSPEILKLKNTMAIMADLQQMADIEQRMKLYLTPYTQLMDPETSRVYPSLSSQLATRRLATSFPNPMQLAKSGNSAYIRSFYLGDDDDHVVVSADWSAIELVLIGEQSGDEGFRKVYGQIPYGDMHSGAAVDALKVKTLLGLTEEEFREFKFGRNPENRVLRDFSGRDLSPSDYHKFARGTAVGKGVNFSYWYSGALSTVANNLSLSDEEHWELVENYRNRFPVAEAWRVGVQDQAAVHGFIVLPDGHRRTKYEVTRQWAETMRGKFTALSADPALMAYADTAIRRLQGRGRNQVVNAMIQGTCATLAKRSILALRKLLAAKGLKTPRLMMPVHDELVYSCHRDEVMEFIPLLRQAMTTHPDVVSTLPLHCTVAIGRTFRPFDKKKPWLSQIELDEAQYIEGVIEKELEGKPLPEHKVKELLEWIYDPAHGI
jgi:DNA polymerase I-like protein with 3'-5' exonuclease and polymerase domains